MRFATALAMSLITASVASAEVLVETSLPASEPPQATNATAVESSVLTKPVSEKVCVMLKAASFEIKMGEKIQSLASAEPTAFLICDNVTSSSTPGGASTLKCTSCKLTLPNGITATADDVVYDSKSNILTLTGSDKNPVTVSMADTVSKCEKLEMKVNPRSWGSPAILPPNMKAVSSRY